MMLEVQWCLILCGCALPLCSPQDIKCTVTPDEDQTTYSINNVPKVSDVETFDCHFGWSDKTKHVLANHNSKEGGLVLENSIDSLVLSRCIEWIGYTQTCMPEGVEHSAICNTTCHIEEKQDHNMLKIWIPVSVFSVVTVAVGLCLCFRQRIINRMCGLKRLIEPLYKAVSMQNNEPGAGDLQMNNM